MAVRRLYCPELCVGINRPPPEEERHLIASLRGRVGDRIVLFDGRGREGLGVVTRIDRHRAEIEVGEISVRECASPIRLTLASAIARQNRQAYLIEKCTELGVSALVPLLADRGVATADGRSRERWERRAIEACKQSGRATTPMIDAAQTVDEVLSRCKTFSRVCAAHPAADAESLYTMVNELHTGDSLLVCIGPEGGWSDRELSLFMQAQVRFVSLAEHVLRVETAAVAACAIVAARAAAIRANETCG
jgi:16S rRNA (uracil1498-N3)-methyltransferase